MKLVKSFKVNQDKSIEILVPDFESKVNYYYKPTIELHMFDEVHVILKAGDKEIVLIIDILNEIIHELKASLEGVLRNERVLPDQINAGELGYHYNINIHNQNDGDFDYFAFWLWSSPSLQTFLYNNNDSIYVEVIETYPWLFSDPKKDAYYVTFDNFMKEYKPIMTEEINKSLALKWLAECNDIISTMIKV